MYLKADDPEPLLRDAWEQKEAQVCELIYNTVDNAMFLQVKGETSANSGNATGTMLWNSHLTTIFHFVLVCYCLAL